MAKPKQHPLDMEVPPEVVRKTRTLMAALPCAGVASIPGEFNLTLTNTAIVPGMELAPRCKLTIRKGSLVITQEQDPDMGPFVLAYY